MTESLQARLRELTLKSIPKINPDELDHSASLFDLGADSLDHAKLLIAIEDDLGIEIEDEDINQLDTIDALASYCAPRRPPGP